MFRGSGAVMDRVNIGSESTPLYQINSSIKGFEEKPKRQYPVGARGNIDEWGAIAQH